MASYTGMSEYDIQLRENYKKQQAIAGVTGPSGSSPTAQARDYQKNNYLGAMGMQTPAVTTPKTTANTQTLGGTSSTGGSSSSGGYTGGGYIAGSGTTRNTTGSTGPSSGSTTNSSEPTYTWAHQDKMSPEDYQMRQEYYEQKAAYDQVNQLPYSTKLSDYDKDIRAQYFYDAKQQEAETESLLTPPVYTWAHQDKMSPEDYQFRQEYYEQKGAYDQVNQLPYANKLSDEDKDIRADFFLEVKPQNFSYVDPSASLYDQYLQIQSGLIDGNQALLARQAELERLLRIFEADPTLENKARLEQHWAQYGNELNAYNKLANQYNQLHSAQGSGTMISELDTIIENLNKQISQNTQLLHALQNEYGTSNQIQVLQDTLRALTEERERYKTARDTTATSYYYLENQEQFQKLAEDDQMSAMYTHAQTIQDDLGKLMDVLQYADDGRTFDYASLNDKTEYLAEKYGLTQEDIENYTIYGRTDLMDELKRQLDYAKDALAASGYDYDRMTEYIRTQERAKERAEEKAATEAYAAEHPGAASLASFLFSLGRVPEYAATMLKGIGHSNPSNYQEFFPMNTYDMHATNTVYDIRSTVTENIDSGVGKFLYQTGMSMADSALMLGVSAVTGVPQIATTCMGMSAAADEARDILERGGSNRQAFWGGLAAGAAEAIFEKFSVDDLLNKKTISGVKDLLTETLKHSAIEGGEEMATEITNIISDAVIMGDKSRFNGLVEHYVSQGMTEEQAKQKATLDKIGEVTMAGIGGAFSGGIFGGMTNGMTYVTTQSLGQAVKTEGLTPTVLQQALSLPADSPVHQMAQDLTDRLNTGLTELGLDLSSEYQVPQAEQKGLIQQVSDTVFSDQAVGELVRLVENAAVQFFHPLDNSHIGGKISVMEEVSHEDSHFPNTEKPRHTVKLPREKKKSIISRGIRQLYPIFCEDTSTNRFATNASNIPSAPGFYDVALHGRDTSVEFFETSIDAYTLAQIIRQRKDYVKGTPIRLFSCNTGNTDNTGDCVAQIVANELGVIVLAPTDILYVYENGEFYIGKHKTGSLKEFHPRGR